MKDCYPEGVLPDETPAIERDHLSTIEVRHALSYRIMVNMML